MSFQTIKLVLSCVVLVQSISGKSIEISSYSKVAKHGNNASSQVPVENVQVQERMDNFPDRESESSGRAMPNNGPFPYQLNTIFLTKPVNNSPKTAKYIYPSFSPNYPSSNYLEKGNTKLSPKATGEIGASDRFTLDSSTFYKLSSNKNKGYQYPVPSAQFPQSPPAAPPAPLLPTIPPSPPPTPMPPMPMPMPMPSTSDGGGSNSPADSAGSSEEDSVGTIKVGPDTQYLPPDMPMPMQMPMTEGDDMPMPMPMDDNHHHHDHDHHFDHDHHHYDHDHGFPYFFNGYHDHGSPEIIWDDHHHDEHHYDEPPMTTTSTTEAPPPPPPEPRVQKYSYFYIGRKLWYIPLYFTLWFTLYVAALIIRSIARHKVALPNHWQNRRRRSLHDLSHEELIEKVNRNTVFIMDQIEDFKNKYLS